jgi:hypothetical protein
VPGNYPGPRLVRVVGRDADHNLTVGCGLIMSCVVLGLLHARNEHGCLQSGDLRCSGCLCMVPCGPALLLVLQ